MWGWQLDLTSSIAIFLTMIINILVPWNMAKPLDSSEWTNAEAQNRFRRVRFSYNKLRFLKTVSPINPYTNYPLICHIRSKHGSILNWCVITAKHEANCLKCWMGNKNSSGIWTCMETGLQEAETSEKHCAWRHGSCCLQSPVTEMKAFIYVDTGMWNQIYINTRYLTKASLRTRYRSSV